MRDLVLLCATLVALALSLAGQEPPDRVRIELTVTAISGASVYLEPGREAGLEVGDRVRLLPAGEAAIEVEIVAVARTSARAELPAGTNVIVGTIGEAFLPSTRFEEETTETVEEGSEETEHPPWEHPPEEWSEDMPLLAPSKVRAPKERELRMDGRTYLQLDSTFDRQDEDTRDLFLRTGVDLRWENPFERGGELFLDADFLRREVSFETQPDDDTENHLRFQRFSYAWGGTRQDRRRWQVGRFLQRDFPEFGRIDGAAWGTRLGGGVRAGASAGFLTAADVDLSTGDDAQMAFWLQRDLVGQGLGWGAGLQKTWHEGAADRDLFATHVDWRPSDNVWVSGSALIDIYTSNERVKDSGPELTELHVFGNWRASRKTGASVHFDQIRWPDIDREEFVQLSAAALEDRLSRRIGGRFWRQVTDDVRVTTRLDHWSNESDSGNGAGLRLDWNRVWQGGRLSADLFANDGEFSSIAVLRLRADGSFRSSSWGLSWELTNSDQEGFLGVQEELAQQAVRANWDTSFGSGWSLSLHADQLFGDAQDATSLGFYLQRRL